jgi:hypothetical protein
MTDVPQLRIVDDDLWNQVKARQALVEAIVLEPDGERLKITLKGDLAGMLSAARDAKRSPDTGDLLVQINFGCGGGI